MRRPSLPARVQRDCSDNYLRRVASTLGFKGKYLPMNIAGILTHPNQPDELIGLQLNDETRREAITRLQQIAWASPKVEAK